MSVSRPDRPIVNRVEAVLSRLDAVERRLVRGPLGSDDLESSRALVLQLVGEMRHSAEALLITGTELPRLVETAADRRIVNILESISDAFLAIDPDERIAYVNRKAELLLERPRHQLLGRNVWESFPEMVGTVFERQYRHATEQGVTVSMNGYYPPLRAWVELHAVPTPDGLTIFFRDITRRKRAEADRRLLAEATAELASSIDLETTLERVVRLAVPHLAEVCVLYMLDATGEIHRVRGAHVDSRAEVLLRRLLTEMPPMSELRATPVRRVIDTGEPELVAEVSDSYLGTFAASERHLQMLRQLAPHSLIVVPLVSRGRAFGALSLGCSESRERFSADDVALAVQFAARAALAIDNARLYQTAQDAARARQDLLHIVSHDLRNSLNAALLHADLLLESIPEEERRGRGHEEVEAIRRSTENMHRLVQDLLDVESAETGRLSVHPGCIDIAELLEEVVGEMEPLAREKGFGIALDASAFLSRVRADRGRIHQVLTNLLGNAIKFSPRGGRDVAVVVEPLPDSDEVHLQVGDAGVGIAAHDLPHVFDRYWRGGLAHEGGGGLGLGLPIARSIVEAHGGRIWAESEEGRGSVFHFTLPCEPGPAH